MLGGAQGAEDGGRAAHAATEFSMEVRPPPSTCRRRTLTIARAAARPATRPPLRRPPRPPPRPPPGPPAAPPPRPTPPTTRLATGAHHARRR